MLAVSIERALGAFFPRTCEICKKPPSSRHAGALCDFCARTIRFLDEPLREKTFDEAGETFEFDRALACTAYEGSMRELIHKYKFQNKKHLASFFSELMLDFLRTLPQPVFFDAVCAVPLEWARFKERGFNQSELLARSLAKFLNIPHLSNALKRKESPSPQSRLNKTARKINVKNRFRVSDKEIFKDRHVLLVDDILTTGHTASECAKVLKSAGAQSVTVLALSRGI